MEVSFLISIDVSCWPSNTIEDSPCCSRVTILSPCRSTWSRVLTSILPMTSLLTPHWISTRCLPQSGFTLLLAPPGVSSQMRWKVSSCVISSAYISSMPRCRVRLPTLMQSASYELILRLVSLLLKHFVSPTMRARGLLSWSCQSEEELNSLSSGSDKELIQLIDHCLDSSDHVIQLLGAARQIS